MNLNELLVHWHGIIFIALCFFTLLQLFYYCFFFARVALYKPQPKTISQSHPVSVIICARDEAPNLVKYLPGALVQEYRTTHEVIVVNDNSFDDSKYLLEEFEKIYKQLHVVELKQEAKFIPGKKFPLSMGIKAAKYEIVLLTDADCVPASEFWIDQMQQSYDDQTEIVLGYGAYKKRKGLLNKLIRWETFHTAIQYLGYALAGTPYMGVGRNLSYRKTIFYRHKGFSSHNHIPSGDDDLFINMAATKKNTRINIHPDAFTLSDPARTFGEWISQKTRHYSTSKHYKTKHQWLLGLYAFSHFVWFPLLALALIFFSWKWALVVFGIRFLVQLAVFFPAMKKLQESDLLPWVLLFDIWMFFYYLLFAFALVKKPKASWK